MTSDSGRGRSAHSVGDVPEDAAVWTVVVGGGAGRRFGRLKQFEPIGPNSSERVIDRSVNIARAVSDGVVVVVPPDAVEEERDRLQALGQSNVHVTAGGDSRSDSVRRGLALVPGAAGYICVHDAARPCATEALYRDVLAAVVAGADAAIPGLAVVDTIKIVDDEGWVTSTPPRASLIAVQTPQAFKAAALRDAHADEAEGSDDASLVEALGGRVRIVEGERSNIKVTHPDDLERLAEFFAAESTP